MGESSILGRAGDSGRGLRQANALGRDCFILAFFLIWHLLKVKESKQRGAKFKEIGFTVALLIPTVWLLRLSNSATSLLSLLLGVAVMVGLGIRTVNKRLVRAYVISGIVALPANLAKFDTFSVSGLIFAAFEAISTPCGTSRRMM